MLALVAVALVLAVQQQSVPQNVQKDAPKKAGTFDDSATVASQPFKSVGVRGNIDAGGYAASATAKAQNEFFQQLADLQVALLHSVWAPPDICAAPHTSLRDAVRLMARGDFLSAVAKLEVLSQSNDQPATRQLLGLAYEGEGQLAAAVEQFRAAAASPSAADADFFALSVALLLEGDSGGAELVSRKAVGQRPDSAGLLSLGAALFQSGDCAKAINVFLKAASARPNDQAPFGFIATAVRSAGAQTLTQCISRLVSLLEHSPKNGTAHYALACALLAAAAGAPDRPRNEEIESHLKQAIALAHGYAEPHFLLGASYASDGELLQAISEYRSALDDNPRLIESHYRLGLLYTRLGQPQEAREELAIHEQLRQRQKDDIEAGKVPILFMNDGGASCPEVDPGR